MSIYQSTALYIDLAAGDTASPWYKMLSPSTNHERGIHGTLTSGDSLIMQFTNEKLVSGENNVLQTANTTTNLAASPSQTTTVFNLSYVGSYRWVRVVKTGTAGAARVVIEC